MYKAGLGFEKNDKEARKWFQKALDRGHEPSQDELDRLDFAPKPKQEL